MKRIILLSTALLITACGGRGGKSGQNPAPQQDPETADHQDPGTAGQPNKQLKGVGAVRVVRGESQPHDRHAIVYTCEFPNAWSSLNEPGRDNVLRRASDATCKVGYDLPVAGTIGATNTYNGWTIEYPEGMKETFTIALKDSEFLNVKPDQSLALADVDGELPIGKMSDCSTLELRVYYKYGTAGGSFERKEGRLTWQRKHDSLQSADYWSPVPAAGLPSPALIQASMAPTTRFYLFCQWTNPNGVTLGQ